MQKKNAKRAGLFSGVVAALSGLLMLSSAAQAAPGDALGAAFTVFSDASQRLGAPAVARAPNGDFVVAWSGELGVYASFRNADGSPKGPALLVEASSFAGLPDVAVDGNGNAVVVWRRADDAVFGIRMQRFTANGTPIGAAQTVSDLAPVEIGQLALNRPAVAMAANGNFVVAWSQGRFLERTGAMGCGYVLFCAKVGGYKVQTRRYVQGAAQAIDTVDSTGALQATLVLLPVYLGSAEGDVDVSMTADGKYVVAWARDGELLALGSGIYARRYAADGRGESKRQVLSQRGQFFPSVAVKNDGSYIVAYARRVGLVGDNAGLFARTYPAGALALAGAEVRVDDGAALTAYDAQPSIASDAAGSYVVAWKDGHSVRAQRFAQGGGRLGINFSVYNGTIWDSPGSPAVAKDASGNFAVSWLVNNNRIDARLYQGP